MSTAAIATSAAAAAAAATTTTEIQSTETAFNEQLKASL